MASLTDLMIQDVARITSSPAGFNVQVTLVAGSQSATIYGSGNNIGQKLNSNTGMIDNVKNSSLVFSESVLLAANLNYPVRNTKNDVAMIGQLVNFTDSTGVTQHYIVLESIPDETVGLITLILGMYVA